MQIEENSVIDQQDSKFISSLVKAIMGIPLENIPEDKRPEIAEQCFSIYENYIYGYFAKNFSQKDLIRIKNMEQTNPFNKFPDLKEKFEEAYSSFIDFIS